MSLAFDLISSTYKVFEAINKRFELKTPEKGWKFTSNDKTTIPKGSYVVIEPDDRNNNRMIISKSKSYELYAISKKNIPT